MLCQCGNTQFGVVLVEEFGGAFEELNVSFLVVDHFDLLFGSLFFG